MRLLVTGGSGFIGSAFCKSAVKSGYEVRNLDISLPRDSMSFQVDLGDKNRLASHMDEFSPDWVVHLAATPGVASAVGVGVKDMHNTANLLEVMPVGTKIMFISTGSIYGRQYSFPTNEYAPIRPQESYYAAAKLGCEGIISAYCGQNKSTGIVLRLGTIIGPGNNKGFIRDFVSRLIAKPDLLETWGNGDQVKSYLHIDDMISAMWSTMAAADGYNEYNVAHDRHASIKQCIPWVTSEMNLDPVIKYGSGESGTFGDIPAIKLCNKRLRNTGWEPQYSIEAAVRSNVRWLIDKQTKVMA